MADHAHAPQPEYEGIYKYPGIIATVIAVIIGVIFIGGLYMNAGDHGGDHGGEHAAEAGAEGEAAH